MMIRLGERPTAAWALRYQDGVVMTPYLCEDEREALALRRELMRRSPNDPAPTVVPVVITVQAARP